MTKSAWGILAISLGLIAGTAGLLNHYRASQRLGQPGVKVVAAPIFGQEDGAHGTNGLFWAGSNSVALPETVLGYQSRTVPLARSVYDWLPKDTVYGQRLYVATNDGFQVINNVVLMGADRTSIHQPQYCLPSQGLQITQEEPATIRLERPHPYDLPVMKIMISGQRRDEQGHPVTVRGIYIYWFVADQQLTSNHRQFLKWLTRDLLRQRVLQRWAYVTYLGFCSPRQEEATFERMKKLIAAAVPEFQLAAGPPLTNASPP